MRTKSNVYIQEKEIHKQKLSWFVGYLAFCAIRNMFKMHISASPTVGFIARNFKNVCKLSESHDKQIKHFDQHISVLVFEWEAKIKIIFHRK